MKKFITLFLLVSMMFLSGVSYANANPNPTENYFVVDNDVGFSVENSFTLSANEVLKVGESELVTVYVAVESYEPIELSILDINKRGINTGFNNINVPTQEVKTNPIRVLTKIQATDVEKPLNLRGLVNSFNRYSTI